MRVPGAEYERTMHTADRPLLDDCAALALRVALQTLPVFLMIMVGQLIGRYI